MIRTYDELILLLTFEERFNYLVLDGVVGNATFGADRYLNQRFYNSREWRRARDKAIERDNACDLAIRGREIYNQIYVHHMNPVTIDDIRDYYDLLLDPKYLICTSFNTHQAITFGDRNFLLRLPTERRKGDTTLWR
jgi:hypothetical protein